MSLKKRIFPFLLCALSTQSFADGYVETIPPGWLRVVTVSAGPAYTQPGRDQLYQSIAAVSPSAFTYVRYTDTTKAQAIATGEMFFALQRNFPQVAARLGIAVAGSSAAEVKGRLIIEGSDVGTYSYKMSHARVAGKAMVIACPSYWINPYVSGSLGVGFNSSNQFATNPPVYITYPNGVYAPYYFRSNTSAGLSYTAGLGANFKLNNNWEIGVGYEFAAWGLSQLSRTSPTSTFFHMPELDNVFTHELQFSLSFLY